MIQFKSIINFNLLVLNKLIVKKIKPKIKNLIDRYYHLILKKNSWNKQHYSNSKLSLITYFIVKTFDSFIFNKNKSYN
jgi:hypothetical protein